ncbi:MAG TPA: phosphoribosylanthranilate isomerase [Hyphomicrobium sp.]|jgi:phosphoribosylanthranilate isomerase|nr:phosphoribosylanthranilate isomerase [Hyphomicrobium sp.]
MTTEAKICGINTREALTAALDSGADYVGFVFFEPSPRHLEIVAARSLAELARGKAKVVALTVDAGDAVLDEIAKEIAPDFLQLHGSEKPERVVEVKEKFGRKIIKAIPVRTSEDAAAAKTYATVADLILFDAKAPSGATRPGGHGRAFDWAVLDAVSRDMPFMLSGGLTPENVEEAIRVTRPQSVDVSSGVETAPGVKDTELIRRFLRAVKTANQG